MFEQGLLQEVKNILDKYEEFPTAIKMTKYDIERKFARK